MLKNSENTKSNEDYDRALVLALWKGVAIALFFIVTVTLLKTFFWT